MSETLTRPARFEKAAMQRQYDHCVKDRPTSRTTPLGQAFFHGYDHPELPPAACCGTDDDPRRAAWAAGNDCRMLDDAN